MLSFKNFSHTHKKKKHQDGELLKEAYLTGTDGLFEGFSNKYKIMLAIQDLQLSDNTISGIQPISKDMQNQLKSHWEICELFSLQFEESTDISDKVQYS